MTTSEHLIRQGNVYRTPEGEIVVVSYSWSAMSTDCFQVHPKLASRVMAAPYLKYFCQFIGTNYRLK